MTEDTKVFESELEGGIKYEIHVSSGFAGRSEVAIKIEGEVVSVVSAEVKRSGNIACRPARARTTLIKKDRQEPAGPTTLNLSDVMGDDEVDSDDLNPE